MSVRSLLISTTCLLGIALAATACKSVGEGEPWPPPEWTTPPAAQAEPWTPSDEWLMLWEWDQEVMALNAESLAEEDRDRQLELHDQYLAAKLELETYFIENPSADAPCATLVRHAQPQQWCSAQDLELEQPFHSL